MKRKVIFGVFLLLLFVISGCKKMSIMDFDCEEWFELKSEFTKIQKIDYLNKDTTWLNTVYGITVSYHGSDFPYREVPVIVLLDGFWHKGWVRGMLTDLFNAGEIPNCLLVSLDYENADGAYARRPDLMYPYPDPMSEYYEATAQGDQFYKFITLELFPKLRSMGYAMDEQQRVLMGHSLGGLFALYSTLDNAHEPFFQKVVAASSSVGQYNNYLFNKEYELYERVKAGEISDPLKGVRLYMGCGNLVGNAPAVHQAFYNRLAKRHYAGFECQYDIFNATHTTDPYYIFSNGIKYLFK